MVIQTLEKTTAVQGSYVNVVTSSQGKTAASAERPVAQDAVAPARPEFPAVTAAESAKTEQEKSDAKSYAASEEERKLKLADIISDDHEMASITEALNKFMAQWNADLQFSLHKDTGSLMVKFVDMKNNKVLKEFPPEEYLDMIVNIRKYIGAMVDKKV